MAESFRTPWLSDAVDIIMKDTTNRIIVHGKEFSLVTHGHWVAIHDDVFADRYYCSECGESPLIEYTDFVLSNYCPNCGAKMDNAGEVENG